MGADARGIGRVGGNSGSGRQKSWLTWEKWGDPGWFPLDLCGRHQHGSVSILIRACLMVPFLPADTMPATILKKRTSGLSEEIFQIRNE